MTSVTLRTALGFTTLAAVFLAGTSTVSAQPPILIRPPIAPPPGTLGFTYRQPSLLVPKDRHPRTAMIDIIAPPDAQSVAVEGLEDLTGFLGNDGIWHFESQTPLLPHVPHIYVVHVRVHRDGTVKDEIRTVRLIPGRIVFLAY